MRLQSSSQMQSVVSVATAQKDTQEVFACSLSKLTQKKFESALSEGKDLARRRAVLLIDKQVNALWKESLEKAPIFKDAIQLVLPRGESAKTLPTVETTLRAMSRSGVSRHDHLVFAVGGGALLDVAGLVTSVYNRGVPIIHVPTTLLAMLDATLGGKTGINFLGSKNQVGSFFLPVASLVDISFLQTLAPEQIREGLVEAVKVAFLAGPRELDAMAGNVPKVVEGDGDTTLRTIAAALQAKAAFVKDDLRDLDKRQFLNFGHTTGHALEAVYGGRLSHGDAVGNGMLVACELSLAQRKISRDDYLKLAQVLHSCGFSPLQVGDAESLALMLWQSIAVDKKRRGGKAIFILPHAPGEVAAGPVSKTPSPRRWSTSCRRFPL
jgi:3-dehydroquinate synthase